MNLKFALPNGSLSEKLRGYLNTAGYPVVEANRTGFCGKVGKIEFYQLDRRMVPHFIDVGYCQAGITGYDLWLASRASNLRSVGELNFSRSTNQPTRWVLVAKKGFAPADFNDKPARIACELPELARKLLEKKHLPFKYILNEIDGSEEQCVASGLCDLAIIVTETGGSIVANGLEIFPGCEELLVSTPRIFALDREKFTDEQEEELQAVSSALQSVVGAQAYVVVVFNFPAEVEIAQLGLHVSVSPTISPLSDPKWRAVEICIPRGDIGVSTLKLKRAGAKSINIVGLEGHLE